MKRIIFPLIITGILGLVAISCNQNPQNGQSEDATAGQDSSDTSATATAPTTESGGNNPPVKKLKAGEIRTISMDGQDFEVTTMYAGTFPKQVYCKTIGRDEEARYYFNSEGKVMMLEETKKDRSGEYIQEIFIYVADSLQATVVRKGATKEALAKDGGVSFQPAPGDPRADADKVSKKGYVLLVSQE